MKRFTVPILMLGSFAVGMTFGPTDLFAERTGVEIWSQTCVRCHRIQPGIRYTASRWEIIMVHMEITARLTDDEADAVLEFLKTSAKPLALYRPAPQQVTKSMKYATLEIPCNECQQASRIQANLERAYPLQPGSLPFPADNKFICPNCGTPIDLSPTRQQIEMQSEKRVVPDRGNKHG